MLRLAVFGANRDLVSLLLSRGANLNTTDRYGISPWHQVYIRDGNGIKYLLLDHMYAEPLKCFRRIEYLLGMEKRYAMPALLTDKTKFSYE